MIKEVDITPILLLESIPQSESSLVPDIPANMNLDMQRFDRRNFWHGIFPKSLSAWILKKHRKDA